MFACHCEQKNRLNNYKQSKHFRKRKTKRNSSKCLSLMMNKNLCNTSWEKIEKDCKKVFILSDVQSKYPQNKPWLCVCIWENIILLEFSKEKIVHSFISQDGRTRIGTHYSTLSSAYVAMDINLKLEYLTSWKKKEVWNNDNLFPQTSTYNCTWLWSILWFVI